MGKRKAASAQSDIHERLACAEFSSAAPAVHQRRSRTLSHRPKKERARAARLCGANEQLGGGGSGDWPAEYTYKSISPPDFRDWSPKAPS